MNRTVNDDIIKSSLYNYSIIWCEIQFVIMYLDFQENKEVERYEPYELFR